MQRLLWKLSNVIGNVKLEKNQRELRVPGMYCKVRFSWSLHQTHPDPLLEQFGATKGKIAFSSKMSIFKKILSVLFVILINSFKVTIIFLELLYRNTDCWFWCLGRLKAHCLVHWLFGKNYVIIITSMSKLKPKERKSNTTLSSFIFLNVGCQGECNYKEEAEEYISKLGLQNFKSFLFRIKLALGLY